MGSATRSATAAARAALSASSGASDFAVAQQLFTAGRVLGESLQLRSLMADPAGDVDTKRRAISAVLGSAVGPEALQVLEVAVTARWSDDDALLAGIEDLGIRAAAASAPSGVDVGAELLAFGDIVSANPELELALGSKLGAPESKAGLVERLLTGRVSEQTLAIVRHLVRQPRGRRVGVLVSDGVKAVADQAGEIVATVTSATTISPEHLARLQKTLSQAHSAAVKLNPVVDPELIGGLRVQIGDSVIDGSIATRLKQLRLQLAG